MVCSALITAGLMAPAMAVDLLYTFEGDAAPTATDKLTGDGAQNGAFLNNVTIDSVGLFGDQSALFGIPPEVPPTRPPYSTLEIPGTTLPSDFSLTLAAFVDNREDPLDFTRLFSSYRGTGGVGTDRILFDMDASGTVLPGARGLRAIVNNEAFLTQGVPTGMLDPGYHHYALVINGLSGQIDIYFDGARIPAPNGEGFEFAGTGYINDFNIFLGEDPHDGGGRRERTVDRRP